MCVVLIIYYDRISFLLIKFIAKVAGANSCIGFFKC